VLRDAAKQATAGAVEGPFILPLVEPGRVRGYREVLRVTVDAGQPIGRWAVYVDAATGEPVAREQTLHFASGTVLFDVPQRGPKGARIAAPAPLLNVFVNGSPSATDLAGTATIPDGGPSSVVAGVQGALVTVQQESGPPAVQDLALAPGGQALWSAPLDEILDAQLSAYIHANIVKQRVKAIAPGFAYLDQNLPVVVNINDICNAFSDGDQINFFLSGQGCENTARIADVVYHEFGHSVHVQSIVEGGGLFEGALSEGISDYLSATITNDSGLARGFFVDIPNDPLRELDPVGDEARWPDDLTGEVHEDGLIIAGTLWDLRKLMIAKHGPATGVALTDNLWFQSIRRAIDIPTMYPEALLADDDDGNLANGTPNACEINQAFFAHGLLGAGSISGAVTLGPQQPEGFLVDLALAGGATACVDVAPLGATLRWRVQKTGDVGVNSMSPGPNGFAGLLPIQPDGTLLEYQVVVDLSDGSELSFPRNPGDPWYQVYIGPVTPLFCTAFEVPPADEGFVLTGQSEWGLPLGQGGDPAAAFDGGQVVGTNLSGTYLPLAGSAIVSPAIATLDFPTVRLQYRRWLTVEDGFFDAATIVANGAPAWQNFNSNNPDAATTHTRDEEWRFHDVDLTPFVIDGTVQLSFELAADGGLEMGGWNLDQLCVVGTDQSATAVCGNGVVEPPETCDAGPNNSNSLPDACRFDCQPARCGDLVIDAGEACDDGNAAAGDGCSAACQPEAITGDDTTDLPTTSIGGPGGDDDTDTDTGATDSAAGDDDLADRGCACTTGGGPAPVGLGLLVLLALRRRRR
jgi:MYXO-CTERM domain-containing protein